MNLDAGTTEATLHPLGAGSKHLKADLAREDNFLRWQCTGQPRALKIIHAYKHLGTYTQAAGAHTVEITARGSACLQAWGPLARSFSEPQL